LGFAKTEKMEGSERERGSEISVWRFGWCKK